ncbi:pseudouridine synthase [Caulobacter sp. SLTY]|uniref:pseudouridine synthase n=1 Tax=Caulobacter sp. SLTY TaxID=2683262 RepID=UPI00141212F5|nr:pseudouridine synthase [Caulobacter sp. SLTY]NBB14351.1 pseudouridine synthase [Caulobacter sp. SLTY]
MAWSRTYDGDEPVRVNKWLGQTGVCSRREAEGLIGEGLISIDGETVEDAGRKILPGQTLTIADAGEAPKLTVVIHKPVGIVSAQPEGDQVPAVRLLTRARLHGASQVLPGYEHRLAPLGRLDMDSRGLLILSEDGVLAKAVIGPDSELDKEYFVQVRGAVTPEAIRLLRHGLELDGRTLRPAKVTEVSPGRLRFVLTEGRNRQIRRMCELVGLEVVDLMRTRVGPLALGELPEGMWRPMRPEERAAILEASRPRPPAS